MSVRYPKRLIEVDLPIKRISAHARREKSISTRAYLHAPHLVGAPSAGGVPGGDLRGAVARPGGPTGFLDKARAEMLAWTSHGRQQMLREESRKRFEQARQKPALFNDAEELRGALLDFIADFANWDNSTVREYSPPVAARH